MTDREATRSTDPLEVGRLRRRGVLLEAATLAWNVAGVAVLAVLAVRAASPALAGFGIDSLLEIGASAVVIWELTGAPAEREQRAMRLIGIAFLGLAVYLAAQLVVVLLLGAHPGRSPLGILWTALTVIVMLLLAAGKGATGRRLGDPVARHRVAGDARRRGPRAPPCSRASRSTPRSAGGGRTRSRDSCCSATRCGKASMRSATAPTERIVLRRREPSGRDGVGQLVETATASRVFTRFTGGWASCGRGTASRAKSTTAPGRSTRQ